MATNKPKPAGAKASVPRGRARCAPLAPGRIVSAGLELIEERGFAAFSTRRLGEVLGCEAMSIYHHFPSKQHLLDAMVGRVVSEFRWPPAELDPLGRLRQVCHAYRETAHRYPKFFPYVAVHRLNMPDGVDFIEQVLGAFEAVVVDRERAARWFRVVGYYLVGAGLDETSGYASGPSAAEPVTDAYVAEHCPRLTAAAPHFRQPQWDATFGLGLEALIGAMTSPRD